jgi:hypothetical protein
MKGILTVLGILLMLLGAIWFLQGIGVLPGSYMTGQTQWVINGGVTFLTGLLAFVVSRILGRGGDK